MRTLALSTVVAVLALLIGVQVDAAQQLQKETAKLTGAAEVPGPGDPKGGGTAELTLDPGKGEVCFDLSVTNLQDPTAAHIHEGALGKEGPVKVSLEAPKTGSSKGCKSADAALIKSMMQDPAGYYVNVHSTAFPKGAVRGQLSE
jgi:CHRD domain-containing protein